jgi:hypothetical protein
MSVTARRGHALLLLLSALGAGVEARAPVAAGSRDDFVSRLQAALLIQTLNADLLSHDSATQTLERWCAAHKLASPARIVAARVRGVDKTPTAEQRSELRVTSTEPVRYRRVHLMCGGLALSEADNWYVPARLTPEMNRALDGSDAPFGRVVQPLNFQRRTLSVRVLAPLLPEGWEMGAEIPPGTAGASLPERLLEHRAILTLPDGTPFSEVVETYTANVLAFPLRPLERCAPAARQAH